MLIDFYLISGQVLTFDVIDPSDIITHLGDDFLLSTANEGMAGVRAQHVSGWARHPEPPALDPEEVIAIDDNSGDRWYKIGPDQWAYWNMVRTRERVAEDYGPIRDEIKRKNLQPE